MLIEERTFPSPPATSVWIPCGVRFILLVNTTTTNSNQKLLRKIVWKSLPSTLHIEHKSIMQLKDTLPDLLLVCLCCIFNVLAHHNLSNFRHFPCTTSTIFQNNTLTHTRTHTHTQELLRHQTNCLAAFACLRLALFLSLFRLTQRVRRNLRPLGGATRTISHFGICFPSLLSFLSVYLLSAIDYLRLWINCVQLSNDSR